MEGKKLLDLCRDANTNSKKVMLMKQVVTNINGGMCCGPFKTLKILNKIFLQ